MKSINNLRGALDMAGLSDPGLVRPHNEDALSFDADLGFVVLADGMGGYNAGEVASCVAVEEVTKVLRSVIANTPLHAKSPTMPWPTSYTLLRSAVELANAMIYSMSKRSPRYAGMGTTLVVGQFYDNRLLLAHVGDSRAYRFRNGVLLQLTRDHSIVQEQIAAGLITQEEANASELQNLVTRAVGIEPDILVELQEYRTLPGDVYLFCSDGLSGMLRHQDMTNILSEQNHSLLRPTCQLIDQANEAGGHDNISVVLVRVLHDYRANRNWFLRLLSLIR